MSSQAAGLVGIVTDVGANYATVRSIIDDSSRVSAMAQQSGDSCIVAGDLQLFKEGRLKLSYMEKDDDIKDGDMIVTSNISGKFLARDPRGVCDGHHGGLQRQPDEIRDT